MRRRGTETLDRGRWTAALGDAYSPTSLSGRLRARRWMLLQTRFPAIRDMRVVDLGGDLRAWTGAGVRPGQLVLVNLFPQEAQAEWVESVVADACRLPESFLAERFDLVYSNSVMEHLGGHWRRTAFAEAIHTLADHHWIQTPYRYFPVEPHWLFPGFQHLPLRVRAEVTRRWPLGCYNVVKTLDAAVTHSLNIELISRTEMKHYFPSSTILSERFFGLTKSLIAVK